MKQTAPALLVLFTNKVFNEGRADSVEALLMLVTNNGEERQGNQGCRLCKRFEAKFCILKVEI